jgi:CDP-glycerol glycerophosphotransferase (TagB/SpsB family)
MNAQLADEYRQLASNRSNVTVADDRNILKYLIMCDIMISDTSSVVYEFVLLNKPVVTVNSKSANINWRDIPSGDLLHDALMEEIEKDNFRIFVGILLSSTTRTPMENRRQDGCRGGGVY